MPSSGTHRQTSSGCLKFASMRTRNAYYPTLSDGITFSIRPKLEKRRRQLETEPGQHARRSGARGFDVLHDDILISIMLALSSTANSPADFVNAMLVSKRFCAALTDPEVLAKAAIPAFAGKASAWSEGAQRFLTRCSEAGNMEACYTLGMVSYELLSFITCFWSHNICRNSPDTFLLSP